MPLLVAAGLLMVLVAVVPSLLGKKHAAETTAQQDAPAWQADAQNPWSNSNPVWNASTIDHAAAMANGAEGQPADVADAQPAGKIVAWHGMEQPKASEPVKTDQVRENVQGSRLNPGLADLTSGTALPSVRLSQVGAGCSGPARCHRSAFRLKSPFHPKTPFRLRLPGRLPAANYPRASRAARSHT